MKEENSVLLRREYGRIKLKLKEEMDARKISRNYLARKIDARFEVVDKWYQGRVEKIDADVLARICFVLKCGVEDILEYTENGE